MRNGQADAFEKVPHARRYYAGGKNESIALLQRVYIRRDFVTHTYGAVSYPLMKVSKSWRKTKTLVTSWREKRPMSSSSSLLSNLSQCSWNATNQRLNWNVLENFKPSPRKITFIKQHDESIWKRKKWEKNAEIPTNNHANCHWRLWRQMMMARNVIEGLARNHASPPTDLQVISFTYWLFKWPG